MIQPRILTLIPGKLRGVLGGHPRKRSGSVRIRPRIVNGSPVLLEVALKKGRGAFGGVCRVVHRVKDEAALVLDEGGSSPYQ